MNDNITEGQRVTVRWTNNFYQLQGTGRIVKVNAKSVLVELEADVRADELTWKAGQVLRMPRYNHTVGNGFDPVPA